MRVNNVPIPGNNTRRYKGPWIEVQGEQDQNIDLTIRYDQYPGDWMLLHCALTFTGVFEYRFRRSEFGYEDFEELRNHKLQNRKLRAEDNPEVDYGGLVEIHGSPYVENMLARGCRSDFGPGQRLGGTIPEEDLKHYRIGFDEYGEFDILALGGRSMWKKNPWRICALIFEETNARCG